MNAWFFTFEYPPEFGGGLSTYMKVMTQTYAARPDMSLVIFTLSRSQSGLMSRRYLHPNVQLITINPHRSRELNELGYWVHISRKFERFCDLFLMQLDTGLSDLPSPDYVEFADGFGIGALSIQQKLCLNSRLENVPIIVTAHTPTYLIDRLNQLPTYKLPGYWTGQLELQALNGADLVVGCSQAIIDLLDTELGRTGAMLGHHAVLHNPFILNPEDTAEPCPAQSCDHFYMASRLAHWKGPESAIKAFEILWQQGINVPFHIYGEDTFYAVTGTQYSAHIQKKYGHYIDAGLLFLHGKLPRSEIDERTRTAYAQVHPSHFDNFPYSLIEAMSTQTICIAGTDGGIREIAEDGKDIFLTDVTDAKAFAQTLQKVMTLSTTQRQSIGENARAQVKTHCDPDTYLARKTKLVSALRAQQKKAKREFPFLSAPKDTGIIPAGTPDKDTPELSIVVPYFNMGAFIDDTIASITKCTLARYEIILVDDGSTDDMSRRQLDALHDRHTLSAAQLKIVRTPNGGVATARNTGITHASAPFVALLDADDVIGARYYEKAIRILKTYDNVSFVGAWIEDYNVKGRIRNWATWNAEPPIQLIMNQTNCQSLVYKRAAFERDGWHDPDLRMFLDDWEGVIALIAGGHRGVMIPEALFEYRIRPGSIFSSNKGLWDINFEKITQKHKDTYNEWGADIAAFMNANGPNSFYHIAGKPSALKKQ